MYANTKNASSSSVEIILETQEERRRFDFLRRQLWSHERNAVREVSTMMETQVDHYRSMLIEANKEIDKKRQEYESASFLKRFIKSMVPPEEAQTSCTVYMSWVWSNTDLHPEYSLAGNLLPARLPAWEYTDLLKYEKDGDFTRFIRLSSVEERNLQFSGLDRYLPVDLDLSSGARPKPKAGVVYRIQVCV